MRNILCVFFHPADKIVNKCEKAPYIDFHIFSHIILTLFISYIIIIIIITLEEKMNTSVIIVCAGNSTRMCGVNKILMPLGEKRLVIGVTMQAFEKCKSINEIIIVARENDIPAITEEAEKAGITKLKKCTVGGATRQKSVINGIKCISKDAELIAVHDGARPLVKPEHIEKVIKDASVFGGATLGVPVKDTIKMIDDGIITDTPPRKSLYITQTPQVFKRKLYFEGIDFALEHNLDFTDDCQLVEAIGGKVYMTIGDYTNIKITTPEDIAVAEVLLKNITRSFFMFRIGHGYDVHRLTENRKFILGGVEIPHEKGLLGHSDADVLAHAIMDAMLGALALGDIGHLFPDTDEKFKGADSMELMREVCRIVGENGYTVGNIDATIIAQAPKLASYIISMRKNIAEVCECDISQISVKATTEEKLGFTGEKLGIAVHAVALMTKA